MQTKHYICITQKADHSHAANNLPNAKQSKMNTKLWGTRIKDNRTKTNKSDTNYLQQIQILIDGGKQILTHAELNE